MSIHLGGPQLGGFVGTAYLSLSVTVAYHDTILESSLGEKRAACAFGGGGLLQDNPSQNVQISVRWVLHRR